MAKNIPIPYTCEYAKRVEPINRSIVNGDGNFDWKSKLSPQFFQLDKKPALYGWYMIEVNLSSDEQYLDGKFLLEDKSKLKKDHTHPILLVNNKTIKRVIFIPKTTSRILFSPAQDSVKFSIKSLRFVKITKTFAIKLMYKKLKTFHPALSYNLTIFLWRHYRNFYNKQRQGTTSYAEWIDQNEKKLINQQKSISSQYKFIILLSLSTKTNQSQKLKTIYSVINQTHPNWSLRVISDKNISPQDILQLKDLPLNIREKTYFYKNETEVKKDIKKFKNLYFIGFSDESILSKDALSVFARNIKAHNEPSILYSDNDILNKKEERTNPNFKPDWNPDLFLSQNYVGDCICINAIKLGSLNDVSFFGSKTASAWIYSVLTQAALDNNETVTHIQLILSHKREIEFNQITIKAKEELEILNHKLTSFNAAAKIGKTDLSYRIRWPLPSKKPLVSIIIPTRDAYLILKQAIDSIINLTDYSNFEIIVVNNKSKKKETLQYLKNIKQSSRIRVIDYNKPFNYSELNNYGVSKAHGKIIALLNNDVEVITKSWLTEMVSHAIRPQIGCVGAMLYYPDERVQHAGVIVGLGGCAGHSHKFYKRGQLGYQSRLVSTQNYSAVTAACLVLEKRIFEEVQGLDEQHLAVAFNDVDLCLKVANKGYRNLWTPWAELYHHESLTRGKDDTKAKRSRLTKEINYMKDTWMTDTFIDPYYSPYLTKVREDFSIIL